MKKVIFVSLCLPLLGFTRIHEDYEISEYIRDEFANVENTVQDQSFRVFNSTPNLLDLKDGEIVLMSSNTVNKLMYRNNQEIYSINASCVTVRR